MKRKSLFVLFGLTAALTLAVSDSNTKLLKAEEEALDPISPSEYLVADVNQYVTPTEYENLEVTQYIYEVTDEMIDEQIQSDLQSYGEEVEVDRPSQINDTVYVDMTYSVQGSDADPYTESTYFYIGYEEFGPEFDEQLIGASVGDTLKFSLAFDDSVYMEDWIDQTVDFEIAITSVCEMSLPEYTDEFIQEYFGYDTIEEYEDNLLTSTITEYEEMSYSETIDELFAKAIEQSVFSGYPQDLYDACKEELLNSYQAFADSFGMDSFYELFDMTEEDIDAEALDAVNRRLFTSWICTELDIKVTEEEYMDYVTEYATYYGYENAAQFEADYTRTSIVWSLYESKVGEYLYESASITEEPFSENPEYAEDLDEIEQLDDEEVME